MALAKVADVAVVSVAVTSTEGFDRFNLGLGAQQDKLVASVAAAAKKTVVVVRSPGAILMPWLDKVDAVIVQFLPGQASGDALASTLFGAVACAQKVCAFSPSGRLPLSFPVSESDTWLKTIAQYPGTEQAGTAQPRYIATYSEKLEIGYRWFDAQKIAPLFPFGHGLSFSSFVYADLKVRKDFVTFTVKNAGKVDAAEVAQLYLGFPASAGEPPQLLRGFQKMLIEKGDTKIFQLPLSDRDLSIWDVKTHGWVVVKGEFKMFVGASSRDIRLTGKLTV